MTTTNMADRDSPVITRSVAAPVVAGIIVGVAQAASPIGFWWLPPATVYALGLAIIASVYIGLSVADGRRQVIAVECGVAAIFVIIAAVAVTGSPWLLVAGLTGHGLKDLWQHRYHYVANTRWWPPFCASVDFIAAAILTVAITTGLRFR
jgi:hypothetical protein